LSLHIDQLSFHIDQQRLFIDQLSFHIDDLLLLIAPAIARTARRSPCGPPATAWSGLRGDFLSGPGRSGTLAGGRTPGRRRMSPKNPLGPIHDRPADEPGVVTLGAFASEAEAMMIVAGLLDAGIEARVVGGPTAGFRAEAPGAARVLVRAADEPEARRVMETIRAEAAGIDWSQVDVGEPEDE
jgi:hypothetical protein